MTIENWKKKVFKGSHFNSWFYGSSLDECKKMGYPYSNACFNIDNNTVIAIGTAHDESPRDLIDNNQNNNFTIDMSINPLTLGDKTIYYAKKVVSTVETDSESLNLDFVFKSSDHLRYENGVHVSGPHGGARRAVKVEPNILGYQGVRVTLFNLVGDHPVWQNNVQMAPKQMKVIEATNDKIILRGYGQDSMGASFADYGLTINIKNGQLYQCILHMHDRGVDIEYLP